MSTWAHTPEIKTRALVGKKAKKSQKGNREGRKEMRTETDRFGWICTHSPVVQILVEQHKVPSTRHRGCVSTSLTRGLSAGAVALSCSRKFTKIRRATVFIREKVTPEGKNPLTGTVRLLWNSLLRVQSKEHTSHSYVSTTCNLASSRKRICVTSKLDFIFCCFENVSLERGPASVTTAAEAGADCGPQRPPLISTYWSPSPCEKRE